MLGEKTSPGARALDKLLATLRLTGGREYLYKAILNLGNAFNGFDNYGHYLRSSVQINNCLDISTGVSELRPAPTPAARRNGRDPAAAADAARSRRGRDDTPARRPT